MLKTLFPSSEYQDDKYARRCGVWLEKLRVVHPDSLKEALAILADFFINGGIELLVIDLLLNLHSGPIVTRNFTSTLGRLLAPLSKSGSTLLFMTSLQPQEASLSSCPQQMAIPQFATVRLLLQKERWLYE